MSDFPEIYLPPISPAVPGGEIPDPVSGSAFGLAISVGTLMAIAIRNEVSTKPMGWYLLGGMGLLTIASWFTSHSILTQCSRRIVGPRVTAVDQARKTEDSSTEWAVWQGMEARWQLLAPSISAGLVVMLVLLEGLLEGKAPSVRGITALLALGGILANFQAALLRTPKFWMLIPLVGLGGPLMFLLDYLQGTAAAVVSPWALLGLAAVAYWGAWTQTDRILRRSSHPYRNPGWLLRFSGSR